MEKSRWVQQSRSQSWLMKTDSCLLVLYFKPRDMQGTLKINAGLGRIRKKIAGYWQHN